MKSIIRFIYNTIINFGCKIRTGIKLQIIRFARNFGNRKASAYLISSSPRSGSTWLSNLMALIPDSYVLFEPLHLRHVPKAAKSGFDWHTYKDKDESWPDGKRFFDSIIKGKIVNGWLYRENSFDKSVFAKNIIIKCVRSNRLLPWIANNININPPILLLRHPCAVVASQLKSEIWQRGGKPEIPVYINEYPAFKKVVSDLDCTEQYLAAIWALDQLPALMQPPPNPWIIVTYEELATDPEKTIRELFFKFNLKLDVQKMLAMTGKPSSVVYNSGISGIDGWTKQLSERQIKKILRITSGFGLKFYHNSPFPDLKMLYDEKLFEKIAECGSVNAKNEYNAETI